MNRLFSGSTHVDIQGKQVLIFHSLNAEVAEYAVIGFENYPVQILDYRDFGLAAINSLLATNRFHDFAPKFNHPAHTTIVKSEQGKIQIELRNTDEQNPSHMLRIAIGIKEATIPEYTFLLKELQPFKNKVALLSIYERPFPNEFPAYYPSCDT
ncbi:MAG: hypothetical protein KKD28_13080 [Chloroflexi bacterium]|nr:hypothetical protein [Chloroflexota bacterium]MBU1662393.1 hypothetical protein [Chloroflexota bacterium]